MQKQLNIVLKAIKLNVKKGAEVEPSKHFKKLRYTGT